MPDVTVSYPRRVVQQLSEKAREVRARARHLRDRIDASPFTYADVARAAGLTTQGGMYYARNVLNEKVTAEPTVSKLETAFERLSAPPPAETTGVQS